MKFTNENIYIYLVVIIVGIIIVYICLFTWKYYNTTIISNYVKKNHIIKKTYTPPLFNSNIFIPKKLFQTWHSKNMPPKMIENVKKNQTNNPELEYFLYDDNDCYDFIKNHFNDDVANAYNKIIPGGYKADLWRYCVMYIHGGVYLDIKYQCVDGFKLIDIMDKERFVFERPNFWKPNCYGIYNAFIIAKPNNPIFLECIKHIVKNTQNNYYGYNELYPTGPGLLGELYFVNIKNNYRKIYDFDLFYNIENNTDIIIHNNSTILKSYTEYREEQSKTQKNEHYRKMWREGNIYMK